MTLFAAVLFCALLLHISAQCSNNPCGLGTQFTTQNGYQCADIKELPGSVMCVCPGTVEFNGPCLPCHKINPAEKICKNDTGRLVMCLSTTDYGSNYACLCNPPGGGEPVATLNPNCDVSVTVTSTRPTPPPLSCSNGGVYQNGICNCPSGFIGLLCENKDDTTLCHRILCKNGGACAIRSIEGSYKPVCLCRVGTAGDFCEKIGTAGFCSPGFCQNNGACTEVTIGVSRYAYCFCQTGYSGNKCETRHFTCTKAGKFADSDMSDHGKYFECTVVAGGFRLEQKSCASGLRFNQITESCGY